MHLFGFIIIRQWTVSEFTVALRWRILCVLVSYFGDFVGTDVTKFKKIGSYQLYLPLYDLLHSYPLSFFRSYVLIYFGIFKTNATTSHSANSSSKLAALRCDGTVSFASVRCVVDIKRHFAQNSELFYRLPFRLLLLSTKILKAISRIMTELSVNVALSVPYAQCLMWVGWWLIYLRLS